ncbi:MAG: hypothetical protein WCI73_01855, partial [Phycisphaerae bacterium]
MARSVTVIVFSMTPWCVVAQAEQTAPLEVSVQANQPTGRLIQPIWNRVNCSGADMSSYDPFTRETILLYATGGRPPWDTMLTNDPAGRAVYNFTPLDTRIDQALTNNWRLRLMIVIPSALSEKPRDQEFHYGNPCPPRDWDAYAAYIESVFKHLVERYTQPVVANWTFRLMSEPDNRAHWIGTLEEYERLYDTTLSAARRSVPGLALDFGNFMLPGGDWPGKLAQWATASAKPYAVGALPRTFNALSLSCYGFLEKSGKEGDGQMGNDPRNLAGVVADLRRRMSPLGDLPVVIEEGCLLRDENNRRLWGGEATELGAAWYAAVFK